MIEINQLAKTTYPKMHQSADVIHVDQDGFKAIDRARDNGIKKSSGFCRRRCEIRIGVIVS